MTCSIYLGMRWIDKSYSETIFLIKVILDFTHVDVDDNKIHEDDDVL